MKVRVSEVSGAALDWLVAKCERHEIESLRGGAVWYWVRDSLTGECEVVDVFRPSSSWSQGGPIIEREVIGFPSPSGALWTACIQGGVDLDIPLFEENGPTMLIAAMRCYVASVLGEDVKVPDELLDEQS